MFSLKIQNILLFLSLLQVQNSQGCTCSNSCTGCSVNGRACGDDDFCRDNDEYLILDNDAGLILRRNPQHPDVPASHAITNCQKYGKKYAEIANADYYDYIVSKIVTTVQNVSTYSMSSPFYVKLYINSNQLYQTLGSMTYPTGTTWDGNSGSDIAKNGMKIDFINNHTQSIKVGYYASNTFNAILCLSSNSLFPPNFSTTPNPSQSTPNPTTLNSTIPNQSTTTETGSIATTTGTTTAANTSICSQFEIIELCSMTYSVNNTLIIEEFDCYELGNLNSITKTFKTFMMNIIFRQNASK
jgi:hypothetical protein